MKRLPPEVTAYARTREFDEQTVPAALTTEHSTKQGVWGRIVVERGELRYIIAGDDAVYTLSPGHDGIIEPATLHRVELRGPARFFVEFLR